MFLHLYLTQVSIFQFHKGTIETGGLLTKVGEFGYFNSIKVRLKRISDPASLELKLFQFHKGTIETPTSIC